MSIVYVLDTSYLDELFDIPGYSNPQAVVRVRELYEIAIQNGSTIFVTLPCIYELANHIASVDNGHRRQNLGANFFNTVSKSVTDSNPWTITPATTIEVLPELCELFANEHVLNGIGLTDTSVIHEASRLKNKYSTFNDYIVHIWTKDNGLKAHEPDTEVNPFTG